MDDQSIYLPPGFRFHPTDEEIITHYLMKKIADQNFTSVAISQANFNDCEPWDLPRKAKMGDKEWYFFCQKDRKYPTGMRTNRATKAGYWKTTGKDKEIFKGKRVLGKKKTLVFYKGRAPKGQRTNWVMHEYRLEGKQQFPYSLSKSPKEEWVVCKAYQNTKDTKISPAQEFSSKKSLIVDDMLAENPNVPPLLNSPCFNSSHQGVEGQPELENELNKSVFSSQRYHLGPWFLHQEEGRLKAPFISNQGCFALSVPGRVEQSSNSVASFSYDTGLSIERNGEASSAISKHQICNLLYSSEVQAVLDFDNILNYEIL
ncbi:hypothetical protein IEQ34_011536 [Dendrobium chrysotoxum]|uniref:NAC domain-containing protein n=1 Tax=Dendrobium chrysotoxum TaxID=161865 RepID=A0AAV7GRI8_DENCH|nr:hypothetical protein IEQ34_011536 [Dendrobium chrysotoxum]